MPLGALTACSAAAQPLRVAADGWVGYAPLFLAQEMGQLPEAAVKLLEFPSNTASMLALVNGEVAAAALTLDELLVAREGGVDARVALVFDESCGADVVMARKDIGSLTELRGRRIGVESTAVGALMLSRALALAGLAPLDIVMVPLTVDQHRVAFLDKRIDAVVTYEPTASRLREVGAQPLLDSSRLPGLIVDVLAVSGSAIERQPDALRQLIACHFQALAHMRTNPANAARLLAPHQRLKPAGVEDALRGVKLATAPDNQRWLGGSEPQLIETAQSVGQLMVDAKLLQRLPDTRALCEPRFLSEAL